MIEIPVNDYQLSLIPKDILFHKYVKFIVVKTPIIVDFHIFIEKLSEHIREFDFDY